MKNIIPEKIRLRKDKTGFKTPEDEWFRSKAFSKYIIEIINSNKFKNRNIIDANYAIGMFGKHLNGKIQVSKEIWKWINLENWFREYID